MKTEFVNLTSHTITEVTTGTIIPRSGIVARIKAATNKVTKHNEIPVYQTIFGEIEGLPEPKENTIYIISALALNAVPKNRTDVVSPGRVCKSEHGEIIGCIGFRKPD